MEHSRKQLTGVDFSDRELRMWHSGGACVSEAYWYSVNNDPYWRPGYLNQFILTRIMREDRGPQGLGCYETRYTVDENGRETFVSRRERPN